jgi:hypothetical protein
MSYEPMPPAPGPSYQAAQPKGAPPPPVILAFRLMLARVALAVIGLIFAFTFEDQVRSQLRDKFPDYTSSHIDDLVHTAILFAAIIAVVFAVLYLLLALQVRKGKNWARIVTWVFAGLGVLGALLSLAQNESAANKTLGIVQGVIDAVIIILLARGPSNDYFRKTTYKYT